MASGTPRRERKVVTVVFCDLVGFTSRAESLDPEDVEAILRPYHERVRAELERHGGTVEKFIGDAVMALFGAPTAHEDDPERAVRAALAIRDFAVEEGLELRVGITTGEALVSLDARPDAGEGMASGDVVNTAARLQAGAPVNGILVDDTTYRATRHVVEFDEPRTIEAKGKSTPIAVRRVLEARARFGVDVAHEARSQLVGRERELGVVRDAFERARHEHTPQLLTLVGVPGIGKSRLVYELSRIVEADPELITWRQGRCLAYGDGITLWALGEIVKAQAGIAEQDGTTEIREKILETVQSTLAGTGDESRVEAHLLALLGIAGDTQLGGDRRNEAFAAWRRFLEGLADQRPVVLVFEDIHWADESLLDFLDELVDWITDVPLLVVCTARPELLERRAGWGGGKLNATTLALAPLSDEQTAVLLGHLLGQPLIEADAQQALLERAGGNPLYAEQFVELYVEQGSTDKLTLPETLQGIIAARLDGLPEAEKELLQDAAVVGKVFWATSIGRDPDAAASSLHLLERKGFVRRQRRSSLEGENELAFAHALVRDVAYGQIPRADRAAKHRRVAEWIESLGRLDDHAEMRAYHWHSALTLVRASGARDDDLLERTRTALRDAGDRAQSLNSFAAAERYYADALELWPTDAPDIHELLFRRANALYLSGDPDASVALETALAAALEASNDERAAEIEALLAHVAWYRGESELVREHLERATDLVGGSPSPEKTRVLALSGRMRTVSGYPEAGMPIAVEAYTMADALDLDELRAHSLGTIGIAKTKLGDPSGIADQERALEIALAIDSPTAATIVNNLGVAIDEDDGGFIRADALHREARRLAERFGDKRAVRFMDANLSWSDYILGRWDDALTVADDFIAECESGAPHVLESMARLVRGNIRLGRGDTQGALLDHERAVVLAREVADPEAQAVTLCVCGATYAALERWDAAHDVAAMLVRVADLNAPGGALVVIAAHSDRLTELRELHEGLKDAPQSTMLDVARMCLDGDLVGAADVVARMPAPALEARLRIAAGQQLIARGLVDEGVAQVTSSLEFHRSVDAGFWVRRAEALLVEAQRDSA